ncbi:MAG: LytR C-terminal domain-containing protein, partial [Gemmatimonadales bacterium]|nr:LytR C-terminal domain-containing protein [Gemmatimonadales bacterium]
MLAVLIVSAGAVRFWPRADLVEGHAYPVPSSTSGRVVEVLNGTDRMGLARITTRVLRRAGYDVVLFKNASEPADSTDILVRRGALAAGQRIRSELGVGRVRMAPDTLLRVD